MTMVMIKYHYDFDKSCGFPDDKPLAAVIVAACPWVQVIARAEAAQYYGFGEDIDNERLTQSKIVAYLLTKKEYDAVEIGRIIKEIKQWINLRKQAL